MQEYDKIWQMLRAELAKTYSKTSMSLWFGEVNLVALTSTKAIFMAPSEFKRSILERSHTEKVSDVIKEIVGYPLEVVFINEGTPFDSYIEGETPPEPIVATEEVAPLEESVDDGDEAKKAAIAEYGAHASHYTFKNFIVGESNKFAYAACKATANEPAKSWNPVFIYGPSGLGKTHLLYAITNEVRINYPHFKIMYVKGEDFTNQMIESITSNRTAQFRERYRKADILLIDDIQFIAGREATQEEFFHTFNALFEDHKQIVLTSDLPPKDIQKLEERLRTRFEWGLIADIQPPNYELRIAIMRKKMQELGIDIQNEILAFLAEHLTNNVRQIEGAVKKIAAYNRISGEAITIPMATNCISDLLTNNGPVKVSSTKIITSVALKYDINPDDIYSKKKSSAITRARQISIYLMRKMSDMSYPTIGKVLNKDHSTIMYSFKQIEQELQSDTIFEIEIAELMKNIREGNAR